jgi:hypothetical protein
MWLIGFLRAVGITSSVNAELRALKDRSTLAIDIGITRLDIE